MNYTRIAPITFRDLDYLRRLNTEIIGKTLKHVGYRNSNGAEWPRGNTSVGIHEVDVEVILAFEASRTIVVSWAMLGRDEGLDVKMLDQPWETLGERVTDVSHHQAWIDLIGQSVIELGAAWHIPNEGCEEMLWGFRITLRSGSSIAIALGEAPGGAEYLKYQPDELVVLFDEGQARDYGPPTAAGAFGERIE